MAKEGEEVSRAPFASVKPVSFLVQGHVTSLQHLQELLTRKSDTRTRLYYF